jgi:hypothetical protein
MRDTAQQQHAQHEYALHCRRLSVASPSHAAGSRQFDTTTCNKQLSFGIKILNCARNSCLDNCHRTPPVRGYSRFTYGGLQSKRR